MRGRTGTSADNTYLLSVRNLYPGVKLMSKDGLCDGTAHAHAENLARSSEHVRN